MLRVKYVGESFSVDELIDGKTYECLGEDMGFLRVIDDSEEDYLYSIKNPKSLDHTSKGGRWEIVVDDEQSTLKNLLE